MHQFFYRLGFDGGGTKTRAVVVDAELNIVGSGASGSSNPYAVGLNIALDNIESAANVALAQANLSRANVSGWGLGLGGVCFARRKRRSRSGATRAGGAGAANRRGRGCGFDMDGRLWRRSQW